MIGRNEIVCLSLAAGLLLAPGFAARSGAMTRQVPADFATIQEAIEASSPRDTVLIAPGDYIESIAIREDSVSVIGAGSAMTRLRGFSDTTVRVENLAAGDLLAGLTLRPSPGVVYSVHARPGSTPLFRDLVIEGGTIGLRAEGAAVRLIGSTIRDCTIGISLEGLVSANLSQNGVSDNLLGISISSGATPVLHENRLERNGIYNVELSSFAAPASIDMTWNWWGSADESAIRASIRRDGSAEQVDVRYTPWCTSPLCLGSPTTPTTWGRLRQRVLSPERGG
jgi:parallel beta-helix repeat protein